MGKSEQDNQLTHEILCLSAAYKLCIRLCQKIEVPDAQLSVLQAGESFNDVFTFPARFT